MSDVPAANCQEGSSNLKQNDKICIFFVSSRNVNIIKTILMVEFGIYYYCQYIVSEVSNTSQTVKTNSNKK